MYSWSCGPFAALQTDCSCGCIHIYIYAIQGPGAHCTRPTGGVHAKIYFHGKLQKLENATKLENAKLKFLYIHTSKTAVSCVSTSIRIYPNYWSELFHREICTPSAY